jgi:histidinol-phosphate/aromatic aminotransferase/cobyric acid decarboxylase-like protein
MLDTRSDVREYRILLTIEDVTPNTQHTAESFTEALCRRGGIMIQGDLHPDYVRISIGALPENEAVVRHIREMVNEKKEIQGS